MNTDSLRRLARFGLSGGVVAVVNATVMVGLVVLGLPAQVALAAAYVSAVCLHFALNRGYVFASSAGYSLRLRGQGIRYLGVAVGSYALTALALAVLPRALDAPALAVYLATWVSLALASFLLLRHWVFRGGVLAEPGGR